MKLAPIAIGMIFPLISIAGETGNNILPLRGTPQNDKNELLESSGVGQFLSKSTIAIPMASTNRYSFKSDKPDFSGHQIATASTIMAPANNLADIENQLIIGFYSLCVLGSILGALAFLYLRKQQAVVRGSTPKLKALGSPSENLRIADTDNGITASEALFFKVLEPLAPEGTKFLIKPRLDTIFRSQYSEATLESEKIKSIQVDFVLVSLQNRKILCGLELDDQTHFTTERMEKDRLINAIFAANRTTLLRIPQMQSYNPSILRCKLEQVCQINISPAA